MKERSIVSALHIPDGMSQKLGAPWGFIMGFILSLDPFFILLIPFVGGVDI
jgi:hypothetical protein